ncbi:MAG: hypothetical protein ACR2ID_08900 [Chthoniobacterales bacterium]
METPAAHPWFLRKHEDGSIFGPLSFEQLARWAGSAQVAPHDYISTDQENWIKAPMLPELGMDWIVEVTSERLYGPTTLGAIREFMRLGEIDEDSWIINSCDATRQQIREIMPLLDLAAGGIMPSPEEEGAHAPVSVGMSIAVQDRIRELEQALREERRALAEAEARYRALEATHSALLDAPAVSHPSSGD